MIGTNYAVSGRSMEPTFFDGDVVEIVLGKWSDGDIIVAKYHDKLIIKRVVGSWLIGDNKAVTNVMQIHEATILGSVVKRKPSFNDGYLQKVEAASVSKTFAESTTRTQNQTLTIPNLKTVSLVSVNTGNVSYKVSGETITFTLQGGSVTRTVQTGGSYTPSDSKTATDSRSCTSGIGCTPASIPYDDGVYSGTLAGGTETATVTGGSTGGTKTVSKFVDPASVGTGSTEASAKSNALAGVASSYPYSDGQGYNGNLPLTSKAVYMTKQLGPTSWEAYAAAQYDGTATKPDTRTWRYDRSYSGTVTKPASDTRTYNYYYQYTVTVNYSDNSIPSISLVTSDNQTLSQAVTSNTYTIQGSTIDIDSGNVVSIKYKINNGTVRAITSSVSDGSTPISCAKNLTFNNKRLWDGSIDVVGADLAENTDHTLTVWAEDDKGGKSAEVVRKFRVVWNRPPIISGNNSDLGTLLQPPSKAYTVTEPENDAFTVTEKINGTVIRSFTGVAGRQETITIPHDIWICLDLDMPHTLTIEATDSKGLASTRSYTFMREEDKIQFELNLNDPQILSHFRCDQRPERILVTLYMVAPEEATLLVEVTNNAFDDVPTWENASAAAAAGKGYLFTNTTKTAANWGINIRVTVDKGTATEKIMINGFGGAFD